MNRIGPKAAGLGVLAAMLAVAGAFMLSANFAGSSASIFASSSTLGEGDASTDTTPPPKPTDSYGPSLSRLGF